MRLRLILLAAALGIIGVLIALFVLRGAPRQSVDKSFDTSVARPAYVDQHPLVLFEEAHHNIHTAGGLYAPFANLISNDGYQVVRNRGPFSSQALAACRVLVIANALGPNDTSDAPAFTDGESDAVRDWVEAGGSLL